MDKPPPDVLFDVSYMPDYMIITPQGDITAEALMRRKDDMIALFDKHLGQSATFCPIIYDISQSSHSALTVSDIRNHVLGLIRRMSLVIVVDGSHGELPHSEKLIRRFVSTLISGFFIVETFEEAVSIVRKTG